MIPIGYAAGGALLVGLLAGGALVGSFMQPRLTAARAEMALLQLKVDHANDDARITLRKAQAAQRDAQAIIDELKRLPAPPPAQIRVVYRDRPAGVCAPAPRPDPSPSGGGPDRDPPLVAGDADRPDDTGATCIQDSIFGPWKAAVDAKLEEYQAQHKGHRSVTEVLPRIPGVVIR